MQRGAELLDREMPGWDKDINLAVLHLNWCDKCVVGQLYEWYYDGLLTLGLRTTNDECEHGFNTHSDDDEDWNKLTEEWRDLIASRR